MGQKSISPVVGVILLVAVVVALSALVALIGFSFSDKGDKDSANGIVRLEESDGEMTASVIRKGNVEDFIIKTPRENTRNLSDVGDEIGIEDGNGEYEVIAVLPDGSKQVLQKNVADNVNLDTDDKIKKGDFKAELDTNLSILNRNSACKNNVGACESFTGTSFNFTVQNSTSENVTIKNVSWKINQNEIQKQTLSINNINNIEKTISTRGIKNVSVTINAETVQNEEGVDKTLVSRDNLKIFVDPIKSENTAVISDISAESIQEIDRTPTATEILFGQIFISRSIEPNITANITTNRIHSNEVVDLQMVTSGNNSVIGNPDKQDINISGNSSASVQLKNFDITPLVDRSIRLDDSLEIQANIGNSSNNSVYNNTKFNVVVREEFPEDRNILNTVSQIEGDGTKSSPLELENIFELQAANKISQVPFEFDKEISGINRPVYFEINNSINASRTEEWNNGDGFNPITLVDARFNGRNKNIKNLYINRPNRDEVGLFGGSLAISSSTVNINRVRLTNGDITGGNITGGLIGYAGGSSDSDGNITSSTSINKSSFSGSVNGLNRTGGLVGWMEVSTVRNSSSEASVNGEERVGGLIGFQNGVGVSEVFSASEVNGQKSVGSLIGKNGGDGEIDESQIDDDTNETQIEQATTPGANSTLQNAYFDETLTSLDPIGSTGKDDEFTSSNGTTYIAPGGDSIIEGDVKGLQTDEMQGNSAKTNMSSFNFKDIWKSIVNDYPIIKP